MLSVHAHPPTQPRLVEGPLRLVVTQVRFPRLFGLEDRDLASFADAIFQDLPRRGKDQLVAQDLQMSGYGLQNQQSAPEPLYRFQSEDEMRTVTLTADWLSLETTSYESFASLAAQWEPVIRHAKRCFKIEHETRLGLRYVNEIDLGPEVTPDRLSEILSPALVGSAKLDAHAIGLFRSWQELRFRHRDGGCTMQHGYVENQEKTWVYVLDFDGYRASQSDRVFEPDEMMSALAGMNHYVFALFKSCFTPEAFAGFRPEEKT